MLLCCLSIVFTLNSLHLLVMSRAEVRTDRNDDENRNEHRAIYLHAFSDLSHVSPATFVYLLKECYLCGKTFGLLYFSH